MRIERATLGQQLIYSVLMEKHSVLVGINLIVNVVDLENGTMVERAVQVHNNYNA
jgi:hypothetical protein